MVAVAEVEDDEVEAYVAVTEVADVLVVAAGVAGDVEGEAGVVGVDVARVAAVVVVGVAAAEEAGVGPQSGVEGAEQFPCVRVLSADVVPGCL